MNATSLLIVLLVLNAKIGLAFMNLLPIPGLDGGHALFTIVEMITGKKPSDKFLEYAQIVGMILLVAMISVILLTLEKSSTFTRRQKVSSQVLRKKEDCIIIAKPEVGRGVKF